MLPINSRPSAHSVKAISEILQSLDARAPLNTAENWDHVGLLVGDASQVTQGVVVSIDLTAEALALAVETHCRLIITHHPCIFPKSGGLLRVTSESLVYQAAKAGVAVACWHTNFDQCALEVVQDVSVGLGLRVRGRIFETFDFVLAHESTVQQGYGFWGEFSAPLPFADLADRVRNLFGIHGFWITNPVPSSVTRVGFVAGKGSAFVATAKELQCDVFITGETGYHTAVAAARTGARQGLAVMELGHAVSERFFVKTMKSWLTEMGLECKETMVPTQTIWLGGSQ